MIAGTLVLAVTLTVTGGEPAWRRIESAHFEIHYLPELTADVAGVTRAAEQAYARVSVI